MATQKLVINQVSLTYFTGFLLGLYVHYLCNLEGDEFSEVSRNRQLTVQFLRTDFAAGSEVSGKNL